MVTPPIGHWNHLMALKHFRGKGDQDAVEGSEGPDLQPWKESGHGCLIVGYGQP